MATFSSFFEKSLSPKWRSQRWLEIAQKLFHQRVGDKIQRRKFGIRLSSISNNKGATAPRKLPFGLVLFSKNDEKVAKLRSRKRLEIAQKLFRQRVGD